MRRIILAALLATASGAGLAAEPRTVIIDVEHMTCPACPITVRKALSNVAGVTNSTVDMQAHSATVTFDPTRTNGDALAKAITDAGFPARVRDGR